MGICTGNSCVITTRKNLEHHGVGLYLAGSGDRGSVEAFLRYMDLSGCPSPTEEEDIFAWSKFCQILCNYFAIPNIVGIESVDVINCDNYDNGTYIIEGWTIVDRKYFDAEENLGALVNRDEILIDIDLSQPKHIQLGLYDRFCKEKGVR